VEEEELGLKRQEERRGPREEDGTNCSYQLNFEAVFNVCDYRSPAIYLIRWERQCLPVPNTTTARKETQDEICLGRTLNDDRKDRTEGEVGGRDKGRVIDNLERKVFES